MSNSNTFVCDERVSADSASCNLLRAVVRRNSADLSALAAEVRDWDALLALAEEHRVTLLLHARLEEMGDAVPQPVQALLRDAYNRNIFHSMANAAELIAILGEFDRASVDALPFKGLVLSAAAYGDFRARNAGDLDLLIRLSDLPRTISILRQRGYHITMPDNAGEQPPPGCSEYRFERTIDGMVTELRWRLELFDTKYWRNLGIEWLRQYRQTTILAGAEVPDLKPEITLVLLSMHGCKHFWSRLIWVNDIARLIAANPSLDWKLVERVAKRAGLWRAVGLGVLLAHRVVGFDLPDKVLRTFASIQACAVLAEDFDACLFEEPGVIPDRRFPYDFQLLGPRDRVRYLFSMKPLQPNELDMSVIRLPKRLHALYYAVRPYRLLRDRLAR